MTNKITKSILIGKANSMGLNTLYSGTTRTLYVKGDKSDDFVKRWSPDKTGHIRDDKGHFIKGGLGFTVANSQI